MAPASSVITSKIEPSVMRPARRSAVRRSSSPSDFLRLNRLRIPMSWSGLLAGARAGLWRRGALRRGPRRVEDEAVAYVKVVVGAEQAVAAGQRHRVVGEHDAVDEQVVRVGGARAYHSPAPLRARLRPARIERRDVGLGLVLARGDYVEQPRDGAVRVFEPAQV